MKKFKVAFLASLLFLGFACEQNNGTDENPIDPDSTTFAEFIDMNLKQMANVLRKNSKSSNKTELAITTSRRFIEESLQGDLEQEMLSGFDNYRARSRANLIPIGGLPSASSLTEQINDAIDRSNSLYEYQAELERIRTEFLASSVTGTERDEGLLEIHSNMIFADFYNENNDLFDNPDPDIDYIVDSRSGWGWFKRMLRCASNLFSAAVDGALRGCGVGGALGGVVGTAFIPLPGFGTAIGALGGCWQGAQLGVLGEVVGALADGAC